MLILGCDTSSIASGALVRVPVVDGAPDDRRLEVLGSFRTHDTRSHAEAMAPGVRDLLENSGIRGQDLDLILAGVGPGPFTGLRAGIMTARAMGWAWIVPVRGVVSPDAVAEGSFHDAASAGHSVFGVATDARRREVYSAVYRLTDDHGTGATGYTRIHGPVVGPAGDLDPQIPMAGRGAELYADALTPLAGHDQDEPLAELLVASALRTGLDTTLESTSPLYLRESDARVPSDRKKATR
ncbi:tRNA (adenosine(37)-N6)-threonylcarbamoyltransferase complex dimerization subunit type 1 TsaB [Rothia sp. HC945]|uniref:tRNA (adenosine(37)-N6)-threonylcarbamoyltransferase complex dimerization subunit type 1 TsaB n=1 Tax=Rothia sp. HC945 TaxID=3171170 RepID=UPI003F23544A